MDSEKPGRPQQVSQKRTRPKRQKRVNDPESFAQQIKELKKFFNEFTLKNSKYPTQVDVRAAQKTN